MACIHVLLKLLYTNLSKDLDCCDGYTDAVMVVDFNMLRYFVVGWGSYSCSTQNG